MKKLHVIFKTHLDIGFTDLAKNVEQQYINDFIPRAIAIGEEIPDQFIWTTGSWLIDFYLEHPEVSEADKARLEKAIEQGTIKWHGLPVTTHTELMDEKLFEYGLSISQKLDKRFGKTTSGTKMTDVPGHTIAIVPLMAKAGMKYLHIGVNASSAMPNVPPMFLWRAKDGSEIIVHYAQDYGETFIREGWEDMLYFAHSHDNQGPPRDADEVRELLKNIKAENPDVEVIPSTLDAFAEAAWLKKDTLPIIEEELGDSWIHGIASDPKKIANYLNLLELRDQWVASGELSLDSQEYADFSSQLLLVAEHTWGGNGNVFLPDYKNYQISDFKKARAADKITFNHNRQTMDFGDLMALISTDIEWKAKADQRSYSLYEESWQEQRDYVTKAIEALSDERQVIARRMVSPEQTVIPLLPDGEQVLANKIYHCGNMSFGFSATGGMNYLKVNGNEYIEEGKEFGGLSYERFDFANYNKFLSQYSRLNRWTSSWCLVDFAKRGIEAHGNIRYELLKPRVAQSFIRQKDAKVIVGFDLAFTEEEKALWGLPAENRLLYEIDTENQTIAGSLKWNGKQANRMPEAYWLETSLKVANPYRWQMHKLNQALSPYDVVEHSNRNIHSLTREGLTYSGVEGKVSITSKEAPLFSFGRRGLLNFDDQQISLNEGIYVNLFNNVWGTNFPAWFEDDMVYHFGAKFN